MPVKKKKKSTSRRLSEAMRNRAIADLRAGMSTTKVSKKYNISTGTSSYYAKRIGVKGMSKSYTTLSAEQKQALIDKIKAGVPSKELKAEFNVASSTLSNYRKLAEGGSTAPVKGSNSQHLTAEQRVECLNDAAAGMPTKELCAKYKIASSTASYYYEKAARQGNGGDPSPMREKNGQLSAEVRESLKATAAQGIGIHEIMSIFGVSDKTAKKYVDEYGPRKVVRPASPAVPRAVSRLPAPTASIIPQVMLGDVSEFQIVSTGQDVFLRMSKEKFLRHQDALMRIIM